MYIVIFCKNISLFVFCFKIFYFMFFKKFDYKNNYHIYTYALDISFIMIYSIFIFLLS